jgi:CheY-like chemotaxis protein
LNRPDHPKVLVVTKEATLGTHSAGILEGHGYYCQVMTAGTSDAIIEVREQLAREHFDLVFAQQHMSPDSAFDVLRYVNKAMGLAQPAVVCLAIDPTAHNAFIREGGASFVPLEPGEVDLRTVIEQGLREAKEYLRHRSTSKARVLQTVDRYTREGAFQVFIMDIFQELKYFGVRLAHGVIEKGKDIVCWEVNKLNQKEFVGVQIKLGDVHAAADGAGITALWAQSLEAFNSEIDFPDGKQVLDKFVVIASGTINEIARNKLTDFLRRHDCQRRVFFLDREEIADLVVTSCPALLERIE